MNLSTVLVANRGEIAVRVMRTAKRLGLGTVAIYSATDAGAPHTAMADVAVEIPDYLDIDAIVTVAKNTGADVVHPGYGFLSERAEFARALEAAGITLAGPSASVMEAMGRKDAARNLAVAAGVPVIASWELPTDGGTAQIPAAAFPVLIKAAAGGGGKGMRVVRTAQDLGQAMDAARREALAAFGDGTLLVEKYIDRGRHIEVQVIGDRRGTVIHLWERDCSTQRRHQKVVEEAPAPTIDEDTRRAITSAAVMLARQVGYEGAGTVEFLLDVSSGDFYFLEMNTRLQVEHPVTEAITGLDLVELQFRVAAGEALPLTQEQVRREGHAIEARIYAEDAFGGFLPQAGTAGVVRWPMPGLRSSPTAAAEVMVRVDQALASGQVVSPAYDPMLAKVIVHGQDRESARRGLITALDDTVVLGLVTNTGFLRQLVASDDFRAAAIDTAWLDSPASEQVRTAPDPESARVAAAQAVFAAERRVEGPFRSDGFRLGGSSAAPVVVLDEPVELTDVVRSPAAVEITPAQVEVMLRGQRFTFSRPDPSRAAQAEVGDGSVVAPMPGTVVEVRVVPGESVIAGQVLGVMEAMKMEVVLRAPFDGAVTRVDARATQQVERGAVLFELDAS